MREIDKLRQRMKNIPKNIVEYRMSIREANAILAEFEDLQKRLEARAEVDNPTPKSFDDTQQSINWDGGGF